MKSYLKLTAFAIALALAGAFGVPQLQAATLTFNGSPVANGSTTFTATGSCQTSGNINFSLVDNSGQSTPLNSTTSVNSTYNSTTGSYDFTPGTFTIPSTYTPGSATLNATCPNGQTISTPITILAPTTYLLNFNTTSPTVSGPVTVSGFCNGTNNNGQVSFTLNDGTSTNVISGANASASGTNGSFTTTLNLPAQSASGLATLAAVCPNGNTSSVLTVMGSTANNTSGSIGSDVGGTNDQGSVAGVSITPTGGVDAGSGSTSNNSQTAFVTVLLSSLVLTGAYSVYKKVALN